MISKTMEYALRAMVYLARDGESWTAAELARTTRVPRAYLAKILQGLVRGGLVESRRGVRGGFSLARPAGDVTILEIVDAVDPIERIRSCPLGLAAHGARLCPLHHRLDAVLASAEAAFAATTLAEVVKEPPARAPRCRFPTGVG